MARGLAILVFSVFAFSANGLAADGDRALSAQGDAGRGRIAFLTCQACHNLSPGGPAKLGPNLDNIFGRIAGTSPAYAGYSKALRESGIVWDERTLDEWLKNPQNVLPGTKMPFAGIRSEQERADLLAFLRAAGGKDGN
jgi:cytochrome c